MFGQVRDKRMCILYTHVLPSRSLTVRPVFQPPFFRGMKAAVISMAPHRSPQISIGFPSFALTQILLLYTKFSKNHLA